jgi:hypothetical protein
MGLEDFATQTGGKPFPEWNKAGLTDLPVPTTREGFPEYFKDALKDPSKISRIDFNIQDVTKVEKVLDTLRTVNHGNKWWTQFNVTKSELHHILTNPELFEKTFFWEGGQRVFPRRGK